MDSEKLVSTWSAHNSTNTEATQLSKYFTTPVIHGSPTDWSNLYTALKIFQGINVATNADHKTIVSMDLQLYAKCIKLQNNESIRSQFVFRLVELHILFAMLKVIGKNINFSGLDETFIGAEIYGPTTLQQIIGGKHYNRSFEAFLTLHMSLFQFYIKELFESKIVLKVALSEVISHYLEDKTRDFSQLLHDMTNLNLSEFLDEFDSKLTGQGKMLRNFMNLVEIMLFLIIATQQRS